MMSHLEDLSLLSKDLSLFLNPGNGVKEEGSVGWSSLGNEESHIQTASS